MSNEYNNVGEELIDELDSLREELLRLHEQLSSSGVERTNGLRKAMGSDCQYYRKSLNLFLEKDYVNLRDKVRKCSQLFDAIDPGE